MPLNTNRVYALILGGGRGNRLFPLTKDRAKPAVPLAGKFRLIDVPISNCINSGIRKIYVLTQFNSQSLHRHIQHSYKFDIFSDSFAEILAAEQTVSQVDWYQGTADAVRRNLWHLTDPDIDRVLILSGDQLYRMNFQEFLHTHEDARADLTLAATAKRPEEATGLGVLKVDEHFRVVDFVEKPTLEAMKPLIIDGADLAPLGVTMTGPVVLASMGIYLFNRRSLDEALANDMTDFGKNIIPACIKSMHVSAHPFVGYWEDIGTIRSFYEANLDLCNSLPKFDFYEIERPIYTHPRFLPNSKVTSDSQLTNVLLSEGCIIDRARITHSVVGISGHIRQDSEVTDTVMMGQDYHQLPHLCEEAHCDACLPEMGIGARCRITRAIIDKNARIGDDVVITSHLGKPDEDGDCYYVRDGVVIIPKNAVVPCEREI